MAKHTKTVLPASDEHDTQPTHAQEVFALENVTQLREAVEQAVYGTVDETKHDDPERIHTVEGLTTLGQMGLLTETDLDEAKKGYL
jgi:hypothetical protein